MRHLVPALELGRILQAEIGREVNDPDAGAGQLAGLGHRDAVRGGEKHDVAAFEIRFSGIGVTQAA